MEKSVEGDQTAGLEVQETNIEPSNTPSSFQVLLEDPLLLQDLVIKEKQREFDQDVNLENYTSEPCQLVEWNRLRRVFHSNRIHVRLKFTEMPAIVQVMRPSDQYSFSNSGTTDIREITDWTGVPSCVEKLIEPQNSPHESGYTLLNYDAIHGWVLLGCLNSPESNEAEPNANAESEQTIPPPVEEPQKTQEPVEEPQHCENLTVEEENLQGLKKRPKFKAYKICPTCKKVLM